MYLPHFGEKELQNWRLLEPKFEKQRWLGFVLIKGPKIVQAVLQGDCCFENFEFDVGRQKPELKPIRW